MAEEWTLSTLKEHLECKVTGVKEFILGVLEERDKAVRKELADAKDRANASNEIRGAMMDQQKAFVTVQAFDALKERFDKLESKHAASENKSAGVGQLVAQSAIIIASVAAIVTVMKFFGG